MTASGHPRAVSSSTLTPRPALADWNRSLNESHAMARLRARGGRVVRWIEARRRQLVADRVLSAPHRRVLDVGCGRGLMLISAAKRLITGTAVGVDIWDSRDQAGNRSENTFKNTQLKVLLNE